MSRAASRNPELANELARRAIAAAERRGDGADLAARLRNLADENGHLNVDDVLEALHELPPERQPMTDNPVTATVERRKAAADRLESHRNARKHPIAGVLEAAASGALPTEDELDGLKLPPAVRRRVRDAVTVTASIKAGGANAEARRKAADSAAEIVAELPPEIRRADYLRPLDDEPDDPAALAAQVARQ